MARLIGLEERRLRLPSGIEEPSVRAADRRWPRRGPMRVRVRMMPFIAVILSAFMMLPLASVRNGLEARAAVSGPAYWGSSETFWNVSMGTDSPSTTRGLTLLQVPTTDSVVLDGFLYIMTKANVIGTAALYDPPDPPGRTNDWNLSVEVTRPREGSAYQASNITASAGEQALVVYATNSSGGVLAGVRFVTGNPATEAAYLFDASTSSWELVANDLRPAFPHRTDAYGLKPDRYIVSFSHANQSSEIRASLVNTASGVIFSQNDTVQDLAGVDDPGLRFEVDENTGKVGNYYVASGWMLDNLMFRSVLSRYPVSGPSYEAVLESAPLWVQVNDERGAPISDASVVINGTAAAFNSANGRYEAFVARPVDWDVPIAYSVVSDGVEFNDTLRVSTVADRANGVSIPKWWNGWDWVTVFGRDDSSTTMSAPQTFAGFNHPTTNYISSTFMGNSTDLLNTQSEVAVHYPHDYVYWGQKTWDEAVNSTEYWRSTFDSRYWFASRWDDPRYVGVGDSYISVACPGNSASWEQVYAQFMAGIRIMGISAQYYLGGNSSLLGSYWLYGPNLTDIPSWASWDPHTRADMMDMFRAISTDSVVADQYNIARKIGEERGVLRLYNHGTVATPAFLQWLSAPKTNFSYENWKATDGEVASYVYGRNSIDVDYNASSDSDVWIYNVSRKDPIESGYWRVPITLELDITDKMVEEIEIVTGDKVVKASNGSLRDLNGSRIMDVGFDVRGSNLYVSYFWNGSSTLKITTYSLFNPRIVDDPKTTGVAYEDFRSFFNATKPDNGTSTWSLESAPSWLSILQSNETFCLLGGFPEEPGTFFVMLRVGDLNSSASINWTITILKQKTVTGRVHDPAGNLLLNQTVMVVFKNGGDIRTVEYVNTDVQGRYSLVFPQSDWSPGDTIEVSSSFDNVTKVNASVADNSPYQQIDLRFSRESVGNEVLLAIGIAAGATAAVVVGLALWRRRKRD